jgi:hypothetical protein
MPVVRVDVERRSDAGCRSAADLVTLVGPDGTGAVVATSTRDRRAAPAAADQR